MSSISAETWVAPRRSAPLSSSFGLVGLLFLATVSAALAISVSNGDQDNDLIDAAVPQIVTTAGP